MGASEYPLPPTPLRGRKGFAAGSRPRKSGVSVERRLAWTHGARLAPIQETVESDRFQARLGAADRKPHETPVAAVEPVIVAAIGRQFRNMPPGARKIACGYNSYENFMHSTSTSINGAHRRPASLLHALSTIRNRRVKALT